MWGCDPSRSFDLQAQLAERLELVWQADFEGATALRCVSVLTKVICSVERGLPAPSAGGSVPRTAGILGFLATDGTAVISDRQISTAPIYPCTIDEEIVVVNGEVPCRAAPRRACVVPNRCGAGWRGVAPRRAAAAACGACASAERSAPAVPPQPWLDAMDQQVMAGIQFDGVPTGAPIPLLLGGIWVRLPAHPRPLAPVRCTPGHAHLASRPAARTPSRCRV